jgi:hypothetical protein
MNYLRRVNVDFGVTQTMKLKNRSAKFLTRSFKSARNKVGALARELRAFFRKAKF